MPSASAFTAKGISALNQAPTPSPKSYCRSKNDGL